MYEKSCFILLTSQCNLKCPHCYNILDPTKAIIEKEQKDLSLSQLIVLFDKLVKNGFTKVLFSGGEALLHPDIFDILNEAKTKGLKTALFTNGHTLSNDVVERLGKAGLKEIRISFNEMVWAKNKKQYEIIFNNQIRYLDRLQDVGISVGYVYIVSGYNIKYTYETFERLHKLGASMKIQPLYLLPKFEQFNEASASTIPLKKWKELRELFANNTYIEGKRSVYGANKEIVNYIDFLIYTYSTGKSPVSRPTGPILVVDSKGTFHPCLFRYDLICGNITNEEDISNINKILENYKGLSNAKCYHEECLSAFR